MLKLLIKINKRLGNKGHFLLPVLGAVAKGVGGAALKGAALVGKGALAAGKGIMGAAGGAIGKGISGAASKMLGMGGKAGAMGKQVATAMGKPVIASQTAQGAGMAMNPGGVMQSIAGLGKPVTNIGGSPIFGSQVLGGGGGGGGAMSKLKEIAGKMLQGQGEEEKKAAAIQKMGPIGGEGPGFAPAPVFRERQNLGLMIAEMLKRARGF